MGRWNENAFDKARDIRPVVENLYARGDAYSPSRYRLAIPEKSPIRVHPRFPTSGGGGERDVIVCPGGAGLITFPRICTSATIIAINPMTTRFPSLAQVGQPRGLSRYTIGPPPSNRTGRFFLLFFFSLFER